MRNKNEEDEDTSYSRKKKYEINEKENVLRYPTEGESCERVMEWICRLIKIGRLS